MKRALCFGINDYPGLGNDLSGCINDARDWSELLASLGFQAAIYLDAMVTRENFLTFMKTEIGKLTSGDYLVIQYSGHGTYGVDMNNDEMDGYDEALYLYDGPLYDDEIRGILKDIPIGAHVVIIFDSCFSGTATRKPIAGQRWSIGKAKFVFPEWLIGQPLPKTMAPRKRMLSGEDMFEILISGCDEHEVSYDAYIGGRYNGAFTCYALRAFKRGQTFKEFYNQLLTYLPSDEYPQTPQLEGKLKNKSGLMFVDDPSSVPDPEPVPVSLPDENKYNWLDWAIPSAVIFTILVLIFFRC